METLRKDPYNFSADKEYYDKGYRAVIGVPGRVLQARELTALALYPMFSLNDLASEIFSEGIVHGFDVSNDSKLETGSIFGMSFMAFTELKDLKVYDINPDTGKEEEVEVNLEDLNPPPVNPPQPPKPPVPGVPGIPGAIGTSLDEMVIVIPHTGEDEWPHDII